jgi:hypothetical protein
MSEKVGLAALLGDMAAPSSATPAAAPLEPTEGAEPAREDLVAVFADLDNSKLPAVERMEALRTFIQLAMREDPLLTDDEDF